MLDQTWYQVVNRVIQSWQRPMHFYTNSMKKDLEWIDHAFYLSAEEKKEVITNNWHLWYIFNKTNDFISESNVYIIEENIAPFYGKIKFDVHNLFGQMCLYKVILSISYFIAQVFRINVCFFSLEGSLSQRLTNMLDVDSIYLKWKFVNLYSIV